MAISGISAANSYLSNIYRTAQRDMASALARLGSNQRFQTASQDSASYTTVANLNGERGLYDAVYATANKAVGTLEAYDAWATQMMDLLVQMKEAVGSADAAKQAGLTDAITNLNLAEFEGDAITGGTTGDITNFDGTADAIGVGAVVVSPLPANVDTAIGNLSTFANSISGAKARADSMSAAASALSSTSRLAVENIYKVDLAEEMAKYTASDIKQQASLAMVAQGNASQASILLLFR
jgi:flagellin-like hook-associated protein FlgL